MAGYMPRRLLNLPQADIVLELSITEDCVIATQIFSCTVLIIIPARDGQTNRLVADTGSSCNACTSINQSIS